MGCRKALKTTTMRPGKPRLSAAVQKEVRLKAALTKVTTGKRRETVPRRTNPLTTLPNGKATEGSGPKDTSKGLVIILTGGPFSRLGQSRRIAWSCAARTAVEGLPPSALTKDVKSAMVLVASTKGLGVTLTGTSGDID